MYTMKVGEVLWNGYKPNQCQVDKYNALSNKIDNYLNQGIDVTHLLIERHQFFNVITGE